MGIAPINTVQSHKAEKTGRKVGLLAGFAGRTAYVVKKEGKDIFASASKKAVENGLKPIVGKAVKLGTIGLIASAFALGGAIIGGAIGRIIDKHNAKKAQ